MIQINQAPYVCLEGVDCAPKHVIIVADEGIEYWMTSGEARKLAQTLIRAAEVSEKEDK